MKSYPITGRLSQESHFKGSILMILETGRLILRRWNEDDAESLYEYARDVETGPAAGWPPHHDKEESRLIISTLFSAPEVYAICLKDDNRAIGCIELMLKGHTDLTSRDGECELGYWLGRPFWGRGLMPEAVKEMLRRAFEDLGMKKVWCAYYDGNIRSKRVQEKTGFVFHHTAENVSVPLLKEIRTEHICCITERRWKKLR